MAVKVISDQSDVFVQSPVDKTVTYTNIYGNIRQIDVLYHVKLTSNCSYVDRSSISPGKGARF